MLESIEHSDTRIDLFAVEPFDFDHEVGEVFPGLHARFVRIEMLIRTKEAAGREKDREDVRQLRLLLENPDDGEYQ